MADSGLCFQTNEPTQKVLYWKTTEGWRTLMGPVDMNDPEIIGEAPKGEES